MTAADLGAVLDAIAGRATALRDAGVREVSVDGISVKLAAPEPKVSLVDTKSQPQPQNTRPGVAEDPGTYGLPPGSPVPGIDWGPGYEAASKRRKRELGERG
jgi:hypothetical protein